MASSNVSTKTRPKSKDGDTEDSGHGERAVTSQKQFDPSVQSPSSPFSSAEDPVTVSDVDGADASDADEEQEETSSSGSSGSDDEESFEEASGRVRQGLSDEGGARSSLSTSQAQMAPSAATSDLTSRIQEFLPQLRRANADLENSPDRLEKRVDHVADDAEHYIEMDLSLGVLSERQAGAEEEIWVEGSSAEEDSPDKPDTDEVGEDVLARLKGDKSRKGTKRKVEELG